MMKKIISLCLLVLVSTNVLAQDFNDILQKIEILKGYTKKVSNDSTAIAKANAKNFNLQDIDNTLDETIVVLVLVQHTQEERDKNFTNINDCLIAYKNAITKADHETFSIKSGDFITSIKSLKDSIQKLKEQCLKIIEKKESDVTEAEAADTTVTEQIPPDSVNTAKNYFDIAIEKIGDELKRLDEDTKNILAIYLFILILIVIIVSVCVYLIIKSFKSIQSTEAKLDDNYNKFYNVIVQKNHDISKEVSKLESRISELLGEFKQRQLCLDDKNNKKENTKENVSTIKNAPAPRPQEVRLYGDISPTNKDTIKVYNEPSDWKFQIILKNEKDSEGELMIRKDLSQELFEKIYKDQSTYLPDLGCKIITSDTKDPSRIETIANGKVRKDEGYTWKIVKPVEVKFV